MTETTDGFEIAERDLALRGPGDFFGTRQAGLPTFRSIDLVRDRDVLEQAKREADAWLGSAAPTPAALAPAPDLGAAIRLIEIGYEIWNWIIGRPVFVIVCRGGRHRHRDPSNYQITRLPDAQSVCA